MKNFILLAGLALGSLATMPASAASLGLMTSPPSVDASLAVLDFVDLNPDGELSGLGLDVDGVDGVTLDGPGFIDFAVGYNLVDPTDASDFGFGGFLDIYDDAGQFLVGELMAIGFVEDVIELQFSNLTGSGAGHFGASVLAILTFDDALGANPFDGLVDGNFYDASVTVYNVVDPTVVPLPAGLPLLLAGFGGLVLLRRPNRSR